MLDIKTALISVYDKKGIVGFAEELKKFDIEILSTGGTAKILKDSGIDVVEISDYTKSSQMLNGRVKTLHPKIHAGLLALRDNPQHMRQLESKDIKPIDMVVVNLYPFEEKVKKGRNLEEVLENIDIGGPTMLRAAAKNYKNVAAVSSPTMYRAVLDELQKFDGAISEKTLLKLATQTFKLTSKYDSLIVSYLSKLEKFEEGLPDDLNIPLKKLCDLRYGENPHQKASFYKSLDSDENIGIPYAKKLHGRQISFNNILDLNAALESCLEFKTPTVSIIKHTNPCGIATDKNIASAFKDAYQCDSMSAFGSIVGLNRKVNQEIAQFISDKFIECIIAPGYESEALGILKRKKNIRLLEFELPEDIKFSKFDYRKISAGFLVQQQDRKEIREEDLEFVTKKKPTEEEIKSMIFGWRVVKFIKSNAIVITKGEKTIGIGAGQPSRVDAIKIAIRKAGERAKEACLASDAFFPMPDSIEVAAKAGINAIIQPGGSIKDKEVIEVADKFRISMVFTGIRHFKH